MALNRNDSQVRDAIRTILSRILGYRPSDSRVDAVIDSYNSRPTYESRLQKIGSAVAANTQLTESQKANARSSDIDRIISEIEAQKKGNIGHPNVTCV